MANEIPRLIAACDFDLVRQLVETIAPEQLQKVDWNLRGRALGKNVRDALSTNSAAWPRLQNIETLAHHGGKTTILSVLYQNRDFKTQLDDLDGSDETAAVWLALTDDELFQTALSALHADRGLNKRSWKAFRVRFDPNPKLSFESNARVKYESCVREAIRKCKAFDLPGELQTHHFQRVIFPDHSHSRRVLDQVTVFAEARSITEEVFVEAQLETRVRKKVDSISVLLDRARRELDVVTIGGRDFISEVASAFCQAFSADNPRLEPLVRRKINFSVFRRRIPLPLDGQNMFIRAKVDEIRVRSPSGMLLTFDAKSKRNGDEDVYDIAGIEFGEQSPFLRDGWTVESARLVLFAAPSRPGRKPRPRSVDLKPNGHTNLLEQDDNDRFIADELLTRWGIFEAGDHDDD